MGDHAESEAVSSEQDDVSFLRTNDVVCLSCTQTAKDGGSGTERVCLGAEGFGNRYCFLETVSDKNYPPDVASCMLVIEQALSIRALQEMVAAAGNEAGSQSGHRTLLYGHAVLLRHVNSDMYLTTLDTSSSSDKLAFDVGLRETAQGEACWWTIHPASKQRSEGEKVRVGDDLILVSVSTERYLHTLRTPESSVIASFHQTQWTILPVATGSIKAKSISFVFSQEIIRFFHGQDECITIPETWADHPQHNHVVYEGGDALERARSLWRVELVKGKWTGAFLNWKQPFRIVHITTGRYMSVKEGGTVSLVGRDKAKLDETAFFLKANKDDKSFGLDDKEKEEEGMGPANIKYGDTFFYIQHATSGLWLSYQSNEVTKRGVGKVEEKIAVMLEEGHMDDTLTFSRAQQEESKSARVIRKCTYLFSKFNNGLDALLRQPVDRRTSMSSAVPSSYNLKEVVDLLKDLIDYFAQPVHGTGHEAKQTHLRALKNRQDLFQQEGVLTLVLDTIDKISGLANSGYMNSLQSEDGANEALLWEEISSFLYLLIAAMIKGNHGNCAQFAQSARLNWLFSRLTQQGSEGVLDVLQSVLTDSPEALNMIREDHIRGIISLLDRSGRDHKILDILGNFCVGNGLAVRSSQNNICEFLLPGKDLLLQTKLVDHVSSVHPNIYVGFTDGSAMFRKWYYEAIIDHVELASNLPPHIRVGWANTDGYYPYPGGGERWGGNGVGDDMFSFGFDGTNIWTGGQSRAVRMYETDFGFHKGDIVGCNIDLTIPEISFSLNGVRLRATIRNFNTTGMFYPVISMSARTSCRFMLGGDQGRLKHGPPSGFSSVIESLPPKETLRIEPNFYFGEIQRSLLAGPAVAQENSTFVPKPIDTTGVNLPNYILQIRDKLAENIHELWSVMKIEAGWTYGDVRDDHLKTNPCLTNFKNLPIAEKNYDMTLSMETLKVLLALGYHISMTPTDNRIRPMKLSSTYTQPNGYKPAPLDLTNIQLTGPMEELKELLAENIHTVWAKNRIDQGWTYGLSQQNVAKRSPHLVPYDSVEDSIKEMNRNTATEVVRTLIAYGYGIDPPSGEQKVPTKAAQKQSSDKLQSRSYRAEKTYAVTEGKWYYEFEVLTPGYMKVGWALVGCLPSVELGVDDQSYAFDGSLGRKWHQGSEPFGKSWQTGDVVGCLLDLNDHTISFTINGELLVDPSGNEAAFEGVVAETEGFVPACTLGGGQRARFNFGQDIHSLKFFTTSGLQEGYEPFCVNMTRPVPFWYNRDQSVFVPVSDTNSMLEVIRIPGSGNTPAGLKLSRKSQGLTDNTQMEFLRLSLPVTTRSHYMSYEEKHQQMVQVEEARRMQKSTAATVQQRNKMEEQMITGGFSVNDIQGLTAQDRFSREQSEDTMDAMMGDMVDEAPRISARMSLSAAPRASLGVDKNQRQRGIMKKTQSLEVAESPDEPGTSGGVTFMQPLSNKRMPRSASEDRFGPNAPGPDGKLKKRSASPFSYITKKIKEAKHRSVSKERLDKTTLPGGLRTPDITLAAGKSGGPSISLRIPDQQQSFESGDMVGNGMNSQHVAFGFDNEAVRPSSTDSRYEADMDVANSNLFDLISEYNYSVRIFPGQEAKQVYMGWVTPDFHHAERPFSMESIRRAEVKVLDVGGQLKDHCFFQNSYLVSAGELQEQATSQGVQEKGRGSSTPGIVISSSIDVATGLLSFSFNGTEIEDRYQVEPGTKLFPVVFVEPTSRDVVQFEFNGTKTALPLSSALFHRDHSMVSQCPPRLRVLTLQPYHWSRVPSQALRVHELKMSDVRGWSMLCDNPVSMLAVYLPEEDRCIDVLELIENEELLQFHARTLALYSSICSHGNHKVAHALVNHVDQKQLLFAIQSPYLSGALRQAFHDLLVALHLDFHAKAMFNTRDEFVIPVKKRVDGRKGGRGGLMRQQSSINPAQCTSLRPLLNIRDKISSAGEDQVDIKNMTAPSFPLSTLKTHIMDALADGVQKGTSHSRDPIGGTYENFFVPLLKIVDQLLLIGFLNQDDMDRLLNMLDPTKFTSQIHNGLNGRGLVHMQLDENVKLQLCYVLQDLCDDRIRKRIEELVAFSEEYVGKAQADQLHRYVEIKQEDLPASIAAKKTKEFRCPPKEQMKMLLAFKNVEEEESASCPSPEEVRAELTDYHSALVARLGPQPEEKEVLTDMIKQSIIRWAAESQIESQDLIKEMFSLMHRQYDGIGEMLNAMKKAYVISTANVTDVTNMFTSLVRIRTLLSVQMGPDEEEVLRYSLWELMNNKVFFQHPDLIGMLRIHENVMTVMMNTIGKSQNVPEADRQGVQQDTQKDTTAEMVVACCKFLCYFCRTSRANQKAMFEHLGYLLDNSSMLLYRPSLRGSAPLDVAYFSLMDNSELALSLRESHLEKIATYLSRCGLQSNSELIAKGYTDVGWDPVEGERYLDFLRFCVWVNGESVEENANLVVRLLIRKPECLGPALRGDGQGLLRAMQGAIALSESTAANVDPAMKEDEDYIDMGEAILNFYSVLVDLLGRCSPDAQQLVGARSDSVRARAILQSLIPLSDLEGVLSMRFFIPNFSVLETLPPGDIPEAPPALLPNHKQAVLVFLERVYGVEEADLFFRLLEETFLPDLRVATMMEGKLAGESDASLALNRYLCNSVLPLLTRQSRFFANASQYNSLLEATLHTAYQLSKVINLTKNQREVISEFLLALIREIEPAMMEGLLRKLIIDVSALSEHSTVALKLLTLHFDRCGKYYGSSGGFGNYGTASEAEKRLTMMLFSRIFDSLAGRNYDPELFNYALPCLSAIGSALPPDYALVKTEEDEIIANRAAEVAGQAASGVVAKRGYHPKPVETSSLFLSPDQQNIVGRFAEHYHDVWALKKYEVGWGYHPTYSEEEKVHPQMEAFSYLTDKDKEEYRQPAEQAIKALRAWGWELERGEEDSRNARTQLIKRRPSRAFQDLPHGYIPRPVELGHVTLNREQMGLSERLAENAHDIWAFGMKQELAANPDRGVISQLVPYDQLTDGEKKPYRDRAQELLKYLIYSGYRIKREKQPARNQTARSAGSEIETRFAYSLLEKLLHYSQVTAAKMKSNVPSSTLTRRRSYKETPGDVNFFTKVVLPLVEQYFRSQRNYFLYSPDSAVDGFGAASPKEKEMVASLFCRLAMLVRTKASSFGYDTKMAVQCLQILSQAIDCTSLIRNSLDFVRTSFLTFFNQAAHDLASTVNYLKAQYFPAARGTTPKKSTSLGYVEGVLLRVLTSLFDHIGSNNFGKEILINEIQIACYSILDSLYTLGTTGGTLAAGRRLFEEITVSNRPLLGACLAAFASTFPVAFLEPEFNTNNPSCILGRAQEQSLEAQDIMSRLSASLPTMETLVGQIEAFTASGDYATAPHIIDVVLPMLCSYLSTWYYRGPEMAHPDDTVVTKVTSDHLNTILTHVLTLIFNNVGNPKASWMQRIAAIAGQIVINSSPALLEDRVLPIATSLHQKSEAAHGSEEALRLGQRAGDDLSSKESEVGEEYAILVRDLYAFYPIAIRFAEIHKSQWVRENNSQAEQLYTEISEVFNRWMRSQHFKREELNFLSGNDVDVNGLISAGSRGICRILASSGPAQNSKAEAKKRKRQKKGKSGPDGQQQSLIVICLKRMLPVGLNLFTGREQELVQKVKDRMLKNESSDITENFVRAELTLPDQPDINDKKAWQRYLYIKIGKKKIVTGDELIDNVEESSSAIVERIMAMSKVLHGLHLVDHPPANANDTLRKLVTTQRKRAIIACFRMISLYQLPRHRVINLFLPAYRDIWLSNENVGQELLVVDLTEPPPEEVLRATQAALPPTGEPEEAPRTDQLNQVVTALSRAATTQQHNEQFIQLYLQYAHIMAMSCGEEEEEEEGGEEGGEGGDEEEAGPSADAEEEKQKLLADQDRLAERGVAEMALMYLSASNGEPSETVWATLKLGISILRGGNTGVQKRMAEYLKDKRDVGFFTSISRLMYSCDVLNLDAFERIVKAEGLGVNSDPNPTDINNENAENTCKLFRFLQLLCEGHNLEFQNYLRTQSGNTATVNLIICTVDYLLRLQESVMDFYWHYSSKEFVDGAGIGEFCRAIKIGSQVFNTLTESIQGPCPGNQLALAQSRLWDAVGGFLFLFANMQDKLSKAKEPSQLDLLQEFLNLQNEMMTMLISMLEGNTLNGPIGKQMVDSLAESSHNLEMIIKFFDIFLKLDEFVNSPAFQEFDPNKDGWITLQNLKRAMETQKIYSPEQVGFLMSCIPPLDDKVDYISFTERYHNPAKDIGFNLSLLLTNLNEHITNDPRLDRLMDCASSMQEYFKNALGRIEIIGSARRVERVYFEIPEASRKQWEQKQIKESKHAFLHAVVNEGGEKQKMEAFVDFCEDAIFEMQHAASISVKEPPRMIRAKTLTADLLETESTWESVKKGLVKIKSGVGSVVGFVTPSNVKRKYARLKRMTYPQMGLGFLKTLWLMIYYFLWFQGFLLKFTGKFLLYAMTGYTFESDNEAKAEAKNAAALTAKPPDPRTIYGLENDVKAVEVGGAGVVSAFGVEMPGIEAQERKKSLHEEMDMRSTLEMAISPVSSSSDASAGAADEKPVPARSEPIMVIKEEPGEGIPQNVSLASLPNVGTKFPLAVDVDYPNVVEEIGGERETVDGKKEKSKSSGWMSWYTALLNGAARHFYTLKTAGLILAVGINIILSFYQVTSGAADPLTFGDAGELDADDVANVHTEAENVGNDEEVNEVVALRTVQSFHYLEMIIRSLAIIHTIIALVRVVAYYHLKVPLDIFKQEKNVARQMEFEGLYIETMPEPSQFRLYWSQIVISTKVFPVYYWDKFVKKKVIEKFKETQDISTLKRLLGEEDGPPVPAPVAKWYNFWWVLPKQWLGSLELRYTAWKVGIIVTNMAFMYNVFYLIFSALGHLNFFFFAVHLVDIVTSSKALTTILQSVTHNGKQLCLTVMMLCILVWLYAVVAFNFFRKFYVEEGEDGEEPNYKCHNMFTCFIFHLYSGVRNGGGIGDAIEPPDGDENEYWRIAFDITFFFFIVVILLAIVQGLIIDAFGDLREQLESVSEKMESECFICGIEASFFDKIPHGFEKHTLEEHNLANYLFFLMHLINKDETEYTGQETYVWTMYQKRIWEFFPVGNSFGKQYEAELEAA